ncbi:MAG: sel1 repeat family protein [Deltaproteobacteria bacterium]|nr:sel1 repeat family protein [Deltaproteobacteria bacterium]
MILALTLALFFSGCGLSSWFSGTSETTPLVPNPPGEAEFLAHNYPAAAGLLSQAAQSGNIRAVFYLRIIQEHGLAGQPINEGLAQANLTYLALRYGVLTQLAEESPAHQKPLYQTALATLLFQGRVPGQKKDLELAATLAEPAAEANFPPAINLMSALDLARGSDSWLPDFLASGPDNCFSWAQKGADLKDALAMTNLSTLYRRGLGTSQNLYFAASWARAAAAAGSARAQNDLGYFYENGLGVTRDPVEALRWYKLAEQRAYPLAKANVSRLGQKTPAPGPSLISNNIDY